MRKINVAIDGPSAAGKSTIAKLLCKKLGYIHLDTGAMYRSTALKALQQSIDLEDEKNVVKMLEDTSIELTPEGNVFLDGKDVHFEIREDAISLAASKVSKLKEVRKILVKRQQDMAKAKGFIMDGRDICTVVLPDAEVKVFMTASAKSRAERRYKQNIEQGIPTSDVETIAKEIEERDEQDMHRDASPLVQAEDATLLDTSDLTIEESVEAIYRMCEPFLEDKEA